MKNGRNFDGFSIGGNIPNIRVRISDDQNMVLEDVREEDVGNLNKMKSFQVRDPEDPPHTLAFVVKEKYDSKEAGRKPSLAAKREVEAEEEVEPKTSMSKVQKYANIPVVISKMSNIIYNNLRKNDFVYSILSDHAKKGDTYVTSTRIQNCIYHSLMRYMDLNETEMNTDRVATLEQFYEKYRPVSKKYFDFAVERVHAKNRNAIVPPSSGDTYDNPVVGISNQWVLTELHDRVFHKFKGYLGTEQMRVIVGGIADAAAQFIAKDMDYADDDVDGKVKTKEAVQTETKIIMKEEADERIDKGFVVPDPIKETANDTGNSSKNDDSEPFKDNFVVSENKKDAMKMMRDATSEVQKLVLANQRMIGLDQIEFGEKNRDNKPSAAKVEKRGILIDIYHPKMKDEREACVMYISGTDCFKRNVTIPVYFDNIDDISYDEFDKNESDGDINSIFEFFWKYNKHYNYLRMFTPVDVMRAKISDDEPIGMTLDRLKVGSMIQNDKGEHTVNIVIDKNDEEMLIFKYVIDDVICHNDGKVGSVIEDDSFMKLINYGAFDEDCYLSSISVECIMLNDIGFDGEFSKPCEEYDEDEYPEDEYESDDYKDSYPPISDGDVTDKQNIDDDTEEVEDVNILPEANSDEYPEVEKSEEETPDNNISDDEADELMDLALSKDAESMVIRDDGTAETEESVEETKVEDVDEGPEVDPIEEKYGDDGEFVFQPRRTKRR